MTKLFTKTRLRRRETMAPRSPEVESSPSASPAQRPSRVRRRWSVADLIVEAAARPPAHGTSG